MSNKLEKAFEIYEKVKINKKPLPVIEIKTAEKLIMVLEKEIKKYE